MIKKLIGLIVSCSIAVLMPLSVLAVQPNETQSVVSSTIEQFDDGSVLITTVYQDSASIQSRSGVKEQKGHKSVTYKVSGGTAFEYTVYGTFHYDGRSAEAVDAWDSYDIYESGWKCSRHSATTSRASAKGSAVFRQNDGTTKTLSATLTCSATGTLR